MSSAHRRSPRIVQPFVDRWVVRSSVKDGGLELACRGADRREFPIAKMRTEHDRRLLLLQHFEKTIQVRLPRFDACEPLWMPRIEI